MSETKSGPITRGKKRRIDEKTARKLDTNTLGLVRGKYLPRHLELAILAFAGPHECVQLVTASKDMYELVKAFFKQLRSCTIDEENDLDWFKPVRLFRFCRQLRTLRVRSSGWTRSKSHRAVTDMIRKNSKTLEVFDSPLCMTFEALAALSKCRSLTSVNGIGQLYDLKGSGRND